MLKISEVPTFGGDVEQSRSAVLRQVATHDSVFGLLDAARSESILTLLQRHAQRTSHQVHTPPERHKPVSNNIYQSLYVDAMEIQCADQGPFLFQAPGNSDLVKTVVAEGWGQAWGMFILSSLHFAQLWRHFRKLIMVEMPQGGTAFFRFYDPRVLSVLLPTCDPRQLESIIPAGTEFIMENKSARPFLFSHSIRNKEELPAIDDVRI